MEHKASTARRDLEQLLVDETAEPKPLPLSLLEDITGDFSGDQEIGRGGFAVVYKGILGDRAVAVKKLSDACMDENKFYQEVICLMRVIKHKNVVRFLGYCCDRQVMMVEHERKLVMAEVHRRLICFEYIPNGSLDKYILGPHREWGICYKIIKGICEGLQNLHENCIVHLDLKPANIMLDDNMTPKITDFGISRCFNENQTRDITKSMLGTMGYMAPEIIQGGIITRSADLYSLGLIIIEIVTGKREYPATNVLESWRSRLERSQQEIQCEQIRVCYETALECRNVNPIERPASALNIIDRLHQTESIQNSNMGGGGSEQKKNPSKDSGGGDQKKNPNRGEGHSSYKKNSGKGLKGSEQKKNSDSGGRGSEQKKNPNTGEGDGERKNNSDKGVGGKQQNKNADNISGGSDNGSRGSEHKKHSDNGGRGNEQKKNSYMGGDDEQKTNPDRDGIFDDQKKNRDNGGSEHEQKRNPNNGHETEKVDNAGFQSQPKEKEKKQQPEETKPTTNKPMWSIHNVLSSVIGSSRCPREEKTVLIRVRLHCEGCAKKITQRIRKFRGVKHVVVEDIAKDEVKVVGTMDMDVAAMFMYLTRKLSEKVESVTVVSGKKGDKDNGGSRDPEEMQKDEAAAAGVEHSDKGKGIEVAVESIPPGKKDDGKDKIGSGDGDGEQEQKGKAAAAGVEHNDKWKATVINYYNDKWKAEVSYATAGSYYHHQGAGAGSYYQHPNPQPGSYHPQYEYVPPPQMFSDENPNACSVM